MPTEFDRDDIFEDNQVHHVGLYNGTVTTNRDPIRRGRVRVKIQGLTDQTEWALPMTLGGGAANRGIFMVPDEGADVFVMFLAGQLLEPVYLAGNWGEAEAVPGPDASVDDQPKIRAIETARHLVVLDEGSGELMITDKTSGAHLTLQPDGTVEVDGTAVSLGGGGPAVGRVGDQVAVTIPPGTFHVTNPIQPGPPTIPNPTPVTLTGTITSGSPKVSSG